MVENHKHDFEWKRATLEHPYHFVGSGLPNVYLSGIKFGVCKICGVQTADIPALKGLMVVIARAVVKSPAHLTGQEIRYLRKRLGIKSADFAKTIGVSEEQVSRWENDKNPPEKSADKLIRVFYCLLSGDKDLRKKLDEHLQDWLATLPSEDQVPSFRARLRDKEWTAEPEPAHC